MKKRKRKGRWRERADGMMRSEEEVAEEGDKGGEIKIVVKEGTNEEVIKERRKQMVEERVVG